MKLCLVLVSAGLLISCGKKSKGGGGGADGQPSYSMTIKDSDSLPTCDDSRKNQLVYVLDEELFKTCSEGEWADIDINDSDKLSIEKVYTYYTDTYQNSDNLITDDNSTFGYLGDIRVYKFSNNNGAFVTASGYVGTQDDGADFYTDDFTHVFYLEKIKKSEEYESNYTFKIKSFADMTIGYIIDISKDTPTFEAFIDTDPAVVDINRKFTLR